MFYGHIKKTCYIALVLILCLQAVSCRNFLRSPEQNNQDSEEEKQPPKFLTEMEQETEDIINKIEDVKKEREKQQRELMQPSQPQEAEQEQQQGDQQQSQEENQQDGEQQEEEQSQDEQQENETSQQQNQPQMVVLNWNELEDSMETIHKMWSSYEPSAVSEGISNDVISSFEEQLGLLTEAILSRNEDNTLHKANMLYSHYSTFLNVYKHDQPPDIKEVKYLVRQAIILGQQNEWDDAKELMPKIKKAWETSKARMEDKDKELNRKIDAVINDFSFLIDSEKITLAQIKRDILLSNLDEIE